MVVYQGPLLANNMTLGATGFWQSMIRPTIYYLTSLHNNFDATRAELIGGIDGKLTISFVFLNSYQIFICKIFQG